MNEQGCASAEHGDILAQHRAESFGRVGGNGVGDVEDRGGGPVVEVESDRRETVEVVLGVEQEPCGRAPESVDGLRVVANERQSWVETAKSDEDIELEQVHVLELVDEYVVVGGTEFLAERIVLHRSSPVQQQVIEVEQPEGTLACHVGAEDHGDLVGTVGAPRGALRHDLCEGRAGIDAA